MFSQRFERLIVVTDHARHRMAERDITEGELRDVIETGEVRHKDEVRIWIARHAVDRDDNLLCVAAILETALVVKTVMHHFSWESES